MTNFLGCILALFFLLFTLREWIEIIKSIPLLWVSAACLIIAFVINSDITSELARIAKTALFIGLGSVAVAVVVCFIAVLFDNNNKGK